MAKKTIAELENQIEEYKAQLEHAMNRNSELVKQANEGFTGSKAYKQMKDDLDWMTERVARSDAAEKKARKELAALREASREILLDNQAFMKDKGGEYWIGITQSEEHKDFEGLKKEYEETKAELEAANDTIHFLQEYIHNKIYKEDTAAETIALTPPKKTGRRSKITEDLVKRVRDYSNQGYSVREIVKLEGISIGLVHKILNLKTDEG